VLIYAIDPASTRAKRAIAALRTPHAADWGWSVGAGLPETSAMADLVVVEGQWSNPKASRQSLMTLSFYAGALLYAVPGVRRVVLPVDVWKGAMIPGFERAPKAAYTANLREILGMPESEYDDNAVDAVGIAHAAARLTPEQLDQYEFRIDGARRKPKGVGLERGAKRKWARARRKR
jgi:hypothetical protein